MLFFLELISRLIIVPSFTLEETMSDWNKKIIEEFRANEGKVGGKMRTA
jgi:hypothetical protein